MHSVHHVLRIPQTYGGIKGYEFFRYPSFPVAVPPGQAIVYLAQGE
jgi:hypothetical protein